MKRTRMDADKRKGEIVKVGARLANDHGLIHVSYLTIDPHCANIGARGIRYHFPNKKVLYKALVDSGLLTDETVKTARDVGLID